MADLSGRVALVTGSTSGIGLAVARRLARSGATLVLNGLADASAAEALCAEFRDAYGVPEREYVRLIGAMR